jgi:hypothetical protein
VLIILSLFTASLQLPHVREHGSVTTVLEHEVDERLGRELVDGLVRRRLVERLSQWYTSLDTQCRMEVLAVECVEMARFVHDRS